MVILTVLQRIKQWFNNHSRSTASGETRGKVLDLTKHRSRKLGVAQVYSQLYYDEKLRDITATRWETYRTTTLANPPTATDKRTQQKLDDVKNLTAAPLWFRNEVVRDCFEEETAAVKAEVERRQEAGFSDDEEIGQLDESGPIDAAEAKRRARAVEYQRLVAYPVVFAHSFF